MPDRPTIKRSPRPPVIRRVPGLIEPGVIRPPVVPLPSAESSLFDAGKPGQAVVRPDDLLALRIEYIHLQVQAGPPAQLVNPGGADAFIVLHFPPQSIAEQVFFEATQAVAGVSEAEVPDHVTPKPELPTGTGLKTPPIRARAAGESRLVFKVPTGFRVDYQLASVLEACQSLALAVPANALPAGAGAQRITPGRWTVRDLAQLAPQVRAQLGTLALRQRRLLALEGVESTTLAARISQNVSLPGQLIEVTRPPIWRLQPRPALPGARQTAIEMPWRLILAPHGGEKFHHASAAVTSPLTARTELWHSRLVVPGANGSAPVPPPRPDPRRTVRAVWALMGEGSDPRPDRAMSGTFPTTATLPRTDELTTPFLCTLDDFDRFQIAHLSSNFAVSNYQPEAVDTRLLMLSSLGGWLDARGAWEPPGLSVEEWVHRATMGRDHYVRVVYKGFLYPFGHRVALIKVSERKFHPSAGISGNPAYLRQRMFIVVRERERTYMDPNLVSVDQQRAFQRQFPFHKVRLLTTVTPDLAEPTSAAAKIGTHGRSLFWPCVGTTPFAFRCVGTDIDGRQVQFELPMIFMDNSYASPRYLSGGTLKPLYVDKVVNGSLHKGAETFAQIATTEWLQRQDGGKLRREVSLKRQRVALAPSIKAGDTSVEVETLAFGGEYKAFGNALHTYSDRLQRPVFYPSVTAVRARIAALAQLGGSNASNLLNWNATYLKHGFDPVQGGAGATHNAAQVFADVVAENNMAKLDFSSQGDRSGGFVMPNLKPSGLSRSLGPLTGPIDRYLTGSPLSGTDLFPTTLSDLPLPLLFGCIPLGEVLQAVAGSSDKLPSFVSEASSQLEALFNVLTRAYGFVQQIGGQSGSLAQAAIDVVLGILQDLLLQAVTLAAAQATPVLNAIQDVKAQLDALRALFDGFTTPQADGSLPSLDQIVALLTPAHAAQLTQRVNQTLAGLTQLQTQIDAAPLPSGFQQSVRAVIQHAQQFLQDVLTVLLLVSVGKNLFDAIRAVVEDPDAFADAATVGLKLKAILDAVSPLRDVVKSFRLLDGATRQVLVDALDAVSDVLGLADPLINLIESLLGEELVVRFDWTPPIQNWALPGANPATQPIFRANDKNGFVVAVEARMKKSGGMPSVSVACGLKHFDLVLINPAAFLELNFEKIEFIVNTSAKMNVDVLLSDIKFVGPLSFVETLKDLIPLDGFSDPPYLDISPSGIDAGFSLALPNIAVGIFSLSNLSLGAGFTVPFIGQPLSVRFNFCTREQPFILTVSMFGGGGFFGVTIDPHGVQILEAAFEFGASISVDFGVASGGVQVMAGIYFRMEQDAASLTGYFRLGGHVSVLGLITASLELYLELRYEFETGKAVGRAQLTIEVEVFLFSASVTVRCERKFAGSNGDPTFRQLMGPDPALPLADELAQIRSDSTYAWREYCEAFA